VASASAEENTSTLKTAVGTIYSRWDQSRGSSTFTDIFDLKGAKGAFQELTHAKNSGAMVLSVSMNHNVDVDQQAFKILYIMCE
jgi:hypothetical protein